MTEPFTAKYAVLWGVLLTLALYWPMRNLIWTLMVRRALSKAEIDEAEQLRLRRRAGVTAGLLSFVFSFMFVNVIMFPD